jgi:hypothetical protein
MKRADGRRGFKAESAQDIPSSRMTAVRSERFSRRQNEWFARSGASVYIVTLVRTSNVYYLKTDHYYEFSPATLAGSMNIKRGIKYMQEAKG